MKWSRLKFFESNFWLMRIPDNIVDEVTDTLEKLRLDQSTNTNRDISPISDRGRDSKRCKGMPGAAKRYFASSGSILDPLLYLRAPKTTVDQLESETRASTPCDKVPSLDEILAAGREQSRLLVNPTGSAIRPKAIHPRQLTSKHTDQPCKQAPKLPVAVFRFCHEHEVHYVTIALNRTYRSIAFSHGRGKPVPAEFNPWETYIERNRLSHYRLCHAMLYSCRDVSSGEQRRLVVIVPHSPKKTSQIDVKKISETLGNVEVRRLSLSQVEKELGFPTFVCPPFGNEFSPKLHAVLASERIEFQTIIDASLILPAKTDCVFDLGIVALRLRTSELGRLAEKFQWTAIHNLVN